MYTHTYASLYYVNMLPFVVIDLHALYIIYAAYRCSRVRVCVSVSFTSSGSAAVCPGHSPNSKC